MSSTRTRTTSRAARQAATAGPDLTPYVGALLRLAWHRVRRQLIADLRDAGFEDLQDAHFPVFQYPGPDGMRPSELAARMRASRQAANYLISLLETLGYLERRPGETGERRRVHLTARGREAIVVLRKAAERLHTKWARDVGAEKFAVFLEVLTTLSGIP
jgi:DNA-binding MarR family transcriptional regulator